MAIPNFRKKPGPDPAGVRNRARGALWGLAVGDALGVRLSGKRVQAPGFPQLCDGPERDMRGGGASQLAIGQVTFATQMAICLADSLKTIGSFQPQDVWKRYLAWHKAAVAVEPQALSVFETKEKGGPASLKPAFSLWVQSSKRLKTNGALPRQVPIGVFFCKQGGPRLQASLGDCQLTHWDPTCQIAAVAYSAAIASAVADSDAPKPEAILQTAMTASTVAGSTLARSHPELLPDLPLAAQQLKKDFEVIQSDDPHIYGPEEHIYPGPSSVRAAFRLAFWELLHAKSFEAGVLDVANRGGDSNSLGTIAGALLGAVHGESAIPERWRERVAQAKPAVQSGVKGELYHPKRMLELADALS
jgi:ADP-ribosylglycohydrolase